MSYWKRADYQNLDSSNKDLHNARNSVNFKTKLIGGVVFLGLAISVIALTIGSGQTTNTTEKINLAAAGDPAQVQIDLGTLEGTTLSTRGGREYFAFYNIPYAKPSVGELRFEPPQEYTEKWTGVRDATKRGNKCIQNRKGMTEIQGDEDCHYLNVYTPKIPTGRRGRRRNLLPVMFYMYGGGFKGGQASNYGGDYIMDKDVVIVLAEYRLGVMGYLSTGDDVISGNMGFKDQVMALKWTQKNIEKFGGDPGKVTIFGNSAGSMSTHAHLLSDMSKGLFHRAISQSGLALTAPNGILVTDPKEKSQGIGKAIGCPNVDDTKELAKCLKNATAASILNAQGMQLFALTVEASPTGGDFSNIFLPDTPLNLMEAGKMNPDVPWIIGVNSGEKDLQAMILANSTTAEYYNNNWEIVGPKDLDFVDDVNHTISRRVREFYFGNKPIGLDTHLNYSNAINDKEFNHPAVTIANMQGARENASPIYLYWLSKLPLVSVGDPMKEVFDPPYGVSHADEVQFIFLYLNDKFPFIDPYSPDYNQSVLMVDIWTTFADTGKPPAEINWSPIPKGHNNTATDLIWFEMNADTGPKMIEPEGIKERVQFWDTFPLNYIYVQNVTHNS